MSDAVVNSVFDLPEFKMYRARWQKRQKLLTNRLSYYDGSVYKKHKLGWLRPVLSQEIRPLYLPLSRAVDVDAGIVPAAWAFAEDAPPAWTEARNTLFNMSKWNTEGVLYSHYGAQQGTSAIKIVDLRQANPARVMIKPVNPACLLLIPSGQYDGTPAIAIWVEQRYNDQGAMGEYAEIMTPDHIRTFYDGQPVKIDGREAEYTNELGFVPYVEVPHINVGREVGDSTYERVMPLLDEVNEMASDLAKVIKQHAEPQWATFGVQPSELVKSGDNVWMFSNPNSKATPLVAGINIAGVLEFVREIRDQVRGGLPELSFDELRQQQQIATATLELQLMELVIKVKRCRPNYDDGLIQAMRLAGRAAASMGIKEVASLDNDDLTLDNERQVLPLDKETAMRLEMQAIVLERERELDNRSEGVNA
ncbi:MAG: phage portal protein [Chloroflexota bacterium]